MNGLELGRDVDAERATACLGRTGITHACVLGVQLEILQRGRDRERCGWVEVVVGGAEQIGDRQSLAAQVVALSATAAQDTRELARPGLDLLPGGCSQANIARSG